MKLTISILTSVLLLSACSDQSVEQSADQSIYGDVTVKQGYPLAEDIGAIESNLQLNRATELFLWSLPMNVAYATRDALLEASGGNYLDVVYSGAFIGADKIIPTLNNETLYAFALIDLSNGPVVYEQPAGDEKGYLFGSLSDVWQVSLTDLGVPKAAPDEGKGGKYLFLPPGYSDAVPENYFVIQSTSNFVSLGMRSVMLGNGNNQSAIARIKQMKLYPLNDLGYANQHIDVIDKHVDASQRKGIAAFRYMHEYLNNETVAGKDLYMTGMLKSLEIEKDKPFPTDKALLANLEKGAQLGWMTAKQFATEHWEHSVFKDSSFLSVGEAKTWTPDYMAADHLMVDRRAAYFTIGCIPPRHMGTSTYYNLGFKDNDGNGLDGSESYQIHLPADVPAGSFWSIIIYSMETFSMIPNEQKRYAISSLDKSIQYNDDESIDIYFGEVAPQGKESNWIPTAGQDFFLGIRFYDPDFTRLGKSWNLKNPELLN